jgi:hypothetical protein
MGEVKLHLSTDIQDLISRVEKLEGSVKNLNGTTDDYSARAKAGFDKVGQASDALKNDIKEQEKIIKEMSREAEKYAKKQATLTAQESAAYKRLQGDINIATHELKGMKAQQDQVHSNASKGSEMFKKFGVAIAGAFSVYAIINFSKQAVAAYTTQIRSEAKLKDALKGRESTVKALIAQANELEKTTLFEDDDIMNAQAMLAINVKDEEQLKKLTQATVDLASAKGMDLASAAQAVNMATMGQSRALKSLGIELDLTGTKSQNVVKVIDALSEAVGGKAQASLSDEEKALHKLQVEADDLNKAWGKLVLTLSNKALGSGAEASAVENTAVALEAMSRSLADFKIDGLRDMFTLVTDLVFPLKGLIHIWDSLRGSIEEMAKEQAASEGASKAIEADKIEVLALAAAYEKAGIPASEAMVKATLAFKLSLIRAREASDEGSDSFKLLTAQINAITEAEKEATKAIVKNIDVESMSTDKLIALRTGLTNKYGDLLITGVQAEDDANKAKLELINKELKYREDAAKKSKEAYEKMLKDIRKSAEDFAKNVKLKPILKFDEGGMIQEVELFGKKVQIQFDKVLGAMQIKTEGIAPLELKLRDEFTKLGDEYQKQVEKNIQFSEDHPLAAQLGFENQEQLDQMKDYAGQIMDFVNQVIDQQVEAANRLVEEKQTQIDEQQSLVDKEYEDRKAGLANSYELEAGNLKNMQAQRDQAVKDREKMIQVQKNLAMIENGISLAVTIANIMKGFSEIPIVGWALGILAVGAMITGFIMANKKAKDATQMAEGGEVGFGLLKGRRHSQGGIPIEAEGGEWFFSRQKSQKYHPLFEAIQKDDREAMRMYFDRNFTAKFESRKELDYTKHLDEIARNTRGKKGETIYGPGFIIEKSGGYTKKIYIN